MKNKKGWDWNEKEENWINKCDIYLDPSSGFEVIYPDGKAGSVPYNMFLNQGIRPYNYQIVDAYLGLTENNVDSNNQIYLPLPNTVPAPMPIPTPIPNLAF